MSFKKVLELNIEKSETDAYHKISGVASSYGNTDCYNDVFNEGSLDEQIGKKIVLKIDHNYDVNSIIGAVTLSKVDNLINFEGELLKGDPLAEKIALMKSSGVPLKVSIGGMIEKSYTKKEIRYIEKATINELSVVTNGANPLAIIEKTKIEGEDNMEKLEKMLADLIEKTEKKESAGEEVTLLKKSIEDLKTELSKAGTNEQIEELKKSMELMDTLLKAQGTNEVIKKEIEYDVELRKELAKNHSNTFEKGTFDEFNKANGITSYADVTAIIDVPIQNDMIKDLGVASVLFANAKKIKFKGPATQIPIRIKKTTGVSTARIGEGVSPSGVKFSVKALSKGVVQSEYPLPDELVADTKFNILNEVKEVNVEDFSLAIEEGILNGVLDANDLNGNKFEGINKNTSFMSDRTVNQAEAGKLTWQEIQATIRKIPSKKRNSTAFYVSSECADLMETMVDANNQPLWRPSLIVSAPSAFLGYPVVEVESMGKKAGELMLLFSNFEKFYVIGLDYNMKTELDRSASKRTTTIITNSRMGGIIRDPQCGFGIKKTAAAK